MGEIYGNGCNEFKNMKNRFNLVIYGATGFTGSIATKRLMESSDLNGIRVAIAGRDQQKLGELQKLCKIKPDIIIADSTNPKSVEAMVQSTKAVLNFAGPFAKYAEPVISACAKWGIDYLDITGEPAFIRTMMDRYHEQANESGARLIPFCGFDSIPADLTTFLALKAASENEIKLDELCLYYQIKGGYNGGSLETALNMAENKSLAHMSDSNILIPDKSWPKEANDSFIPRYEFDFARWSASFFMAPVNKAVVRRSAWLRSRLNEAKAKSEPDFHYEERWLMPQNYGFLTAWLTTGFEAVFGLLASTSIGRQLVRRYALPPGQGPSEEERLAGFVRVQLVGRSCGHAKLRICMERQGDPGNEFTVALAIECARLVVENDFATKETGFLTPSVAFGKRLFDRLEAAGVSFKTELVDEALTDQMYETNDSATLPNPTQKHY